MDSMGILNFLRIKMAKNSDLSVEKGISRQKIKEIYG